MASVAKGCECSRLPKDSRPCRFCREQASTKVVDLGRLRENQPGFGGDSGHAN
jgi:hypothetical protein